MKIRVNIWLVILVLAAFKLSWVYDLSATNDWVWTYRKTLSESDRKHLHNKPTLLFVKEAVPLFSQLIFSWNALRPEQGYFSFYVQARNARNKQWGTWHHMMDWGAGVQRSYASKTDGLSHYTHVRLEIEKGKHADGFRIKVRAQDGARIAQLLGFAAATANYNQFKAESYDNRIKRLSSHHITHVPKLSQFALNHSDKDRLCSPTSCTILVRYLTGQQIDHVDFAGHVFDHGLQAYGSWPFNTAHAFERLAGTSWIFPTRLNSFVDLYKQLKRNVPIIVSVRGSLRGAAKPYRDGHLLVVVGWDAQKKEVICHDPAFKSHKRTLRRYSFADFVRAWESSRRLVYWAEPI